MPVACSKHSLAGLLPLVPFLLSHLHPLCKLLCSPMLTADMLELVHLRF